MSSEGSVTRWLDQLKAGDAAAAEQLWQRFFPRLVALARQKLAGTRRGPVDEEDVVLSAFDSFFQRAEQGRFPQLHDRDDLWQLLVVITVRKAINVRVKENRQKRGGGRRYEWTDPEAQYQTLDLTPDPQPSPDLAAQLAEEYQRLLALLPTEELRQIAVWKMEGWTSAEMAGQLGVVPRTIERRLEAIRQCWEQEVGE